MDERTAKLAGEARAAREKMEAVRRRYHAKIASYDELAEAGKAFCAAFDAYHLARFGKRKRLDFRAVIR